MREPKDRIFASINQKKRKPATLCDSQAYRYQWAGLDSNQRRLTPMGLQPLCQDTQPPINKQLTEGGQDRLQTSLQKNPENTPKSVQDLPPDLAKIIAVWPKLPPHIRAEIFNLSRPYKKPIVFNCGYAKFSFEGFTEFLQEWGITVLVDIRSKPYSRKKGFSRNNLQNNLPCKYLWRGETLGGLEGIQTERWKAGLREIAEIAQTETVMLMCLEYDINHCHRKDLAQILYTFYDCENINT